MIFLNINEYEAKKAKLISLRMDFNEEVTTKRRCLVTNRGTRYYLEHSKEELFKMGMNEIAIMSQVKKECSKALKNGVSAPFNKNKSNYMAYSDKIEQGLVYGDVVQIDINSAYLTAAKNRGFISEKTYNKFFEIEDNKKRIAKKSSLCEQHVKQYITKDGEILKYSKKCRLISLGRLAQQKTVLKYKGFKGKEISFCPKTNKFNTSIEYYEGGKSKLVEEVDMYNESEANIFFTCSYDVDKCLMDCMEIEGVFFYWVDAVFCHKDVVEKVVKVIENHCFCWKKKEHDFLTLRDDFIFVDAKKYSFSKYKRIDKISRHRDLEKEFKKSMKLYNELKSMSLEKQLSSVSNVMGCSISDLEYFCKNTGYTPIEYLTFLDLCEILEIERTDDFNTFYLCRKLNELDMNIKHFIRVLDVQVSEVKKDNKDILIKTVVFFQSESFLKNEPLEKELDEIFGKRLYTKVIPTLDNFDLTINRQFI